MRRPTKKVTLTDLINALNKAIDFKDRKEEKSVMMRRAVERLIEPEEDIELKIKNIFDRIAKRYSMRFSELVIVWKRKDIVDVFLPLLYLEQRGKIICEQEEMFKDINIKVREGVPNA